MTATGAPERGRQGHRGRARHRPAVTGFGASRLLGLDPQTDQAEVRKIVGVQA
jgi:hypothetical protein